MKKQVFAKVILASISPNAHSLHTVHARFPRIVLAEGNTHRAISKNAGSSRAIPTARMLRQVMTDPACPTEWGLNQPGMQAEEQAYGWRLALGKSIWHSAAFLAGVHSWALMFLGFHKQVANRVTEPYQYVNGLWSATGWENFDVLRCHPDADPTMRDIAIEIMMAIELSTPRFVNWNEWHLPYILDEEWGQYDITVLRQLSVARCARVSIAPFDGNASIEKEQSRFKKLVGSFPPHSSPTEHQGTPCTLDTRSGNFHGWKQYRQELEEFNPPVFTRGLRREPTRDEIAAYWEERNNAMTTYPRGVRVPKSPLISGSNL